jgi:hypothetical protein
MGSSKKEAEQQAAEGAWRVLSAETLEALEPLEPVEPGAPADSA